MTNSLEFETLHLQARSTARSLETALFAVPCRCPGTRATGRATPSFLARLDRRVTAPAAASSSGVALPVA